MPLLLAALSFFAAYDTLAQENLAVYDYAGIAALAVFMGGVFFWVVLMFCACMAAYRGITQALRKVLPALLLAGRRGNRPAK